MGVQGGGKKATNLSLDQALLAIEEVDGGGGKIPGAAGVDPRFGLDAEAVFIGKADRLGGASFDGSDDWRKPRIREISSARNGFYSQGFTAGLGRKRVGA